MAYAITPHIEANFGPVGTGTPYKVDWVNNVCGVMIAAGWEPEVVQETNTNNPGGPYYRTVAPVVLFIEQSGEFDSFGLFASPPGDSCDGLSVWGVLPGTGGISLGIDLTPGQFSEVANCCICNGACAAGSKWGTGAGGTGTGSCGLDCVDGGAGLCTVIETWNWSSGDISGQHNSLLAQIVKHTGGCSSAPKKSAVLSQTITGSSAETLLAIWCEGGSTNPLIGPTELDVPGVGAAFNSSVSRRHGGWVLKSQPSNTAENQFVAYFSVDRVGADNPSVWSFSTYTAQTHPVLYIEGTSTLAGLGHRFDFNNTTNDMRFVANPYHAHMYSHRGGTAVSTGSQNEFSIGALRTIPLNGEDPNDPDSWDFKRALFMAGANGASACVSLHQQNWVNPDTQQWYLIEDSTAGTSTSVTSVDGHQLSVAGFVWTLNNSADPLVWISGEAFYSEPWAGFNAFAGTTMSPILGQLWDCVVPSKVSGGGYFFWDGEWWLHWGDLRTTTASGGGPVSNISWRVGFQTLEGDEPISGTWAGLPDPKDVFLYHVQQNSLIEPFPWGNMAGLSISTSTFAGGTTTATITATCTQHPDAPDDGDKLVAIHSLRNYFTFTPEVITIGDGDTTGTSVVTAVSPGLGGVNVDIYADSITQASLTVTVED